ncbi:MAG: hypothetical protein EXR79_14715 [Myxococcales bacterium]|nr:hypothetical protein [Myxococcales bacterium]
MGRAPRIAWFAACACMGCSEAIPEPARFEFQTRDERLDAPAAANADVLDAGGDATAATAADAGRTLADAADAQAAGTIDVPAAEAGCPAGCDDKQPCTLDECEASACVHKSVANGKACAITGDPCTVSSCMAGVCESKTPLWQHVIGGAFEDRAAAIAAVPAAAGVSGWVAVGHDAVSASDNDSAVWRFDAAGTLMWKWVDQTSGSTRWHAVLVTASHAVVFGDLENVEGVDSQGVFATVALASGMAGTKQFKITPLSFNRFRAAAPLGVGWVAVGSTGGKSTPSNGWIAVLDADGKVYKQWNFGGQGEDVATAVVSVGDGFVVAAALGLGGVTGADIEIARYNGNGQVLWKAGAAGDTDERDPRLAALSDGGLIAAWNEGTSAAGGIYEVRIQRLDAAGKVVVNTKLSGLGKSASLRAFGLAAAPDGTLRLAGALTSGTEVNGWVAGLSPWGAVLWQELSGPDTWLGLGVAADGSIGLAGTATGTDDGAHDAVVRRADAWGRVACAKAGVCSTKSLQSCSTKSLCAADLCSATAACLKKPFPIGTACGAAQVCDAGELCATPKANTWKVITKESKFEPASFAIKAGDSVEFTLEGMHNVIEVDKQTWDVDGSLPKLGGFAVDFGAKKVVTFPTAGTYLYVCAVHAGLGMKGSIVVK